MADDEDDADDGYLVVVMKMRVRIVFCCQMEVHRWAVRGRSPQRLP